MFYETDNLHIIADVRFQRVSTVLCKLIVYIITSKSILIVS